MAKKQTRRTVSYSRRVFEAATIYAASLGKPLSRVAEDLMLAAIGDAELTASVEMHRDHERQRLAPRSSAPVARPVIRQPTDEDRVDCSGLFSARSGRQTDPSCRSRQAALAVVDYGWTVTQAAAAYRLTTAPVSTYVAMLRRERGIEVPRRVIDGGKSRRAAIAVIDHGRVASEVASELGISRQAVSQYVARLRAERANGHAGVR